MVSIVARVSKVGSIVLATVPGPGPTHTVAELAVQVVNKPELSTRVRFDCKLPTRLNRAGYQRVAQWVHAEIQLGINFLEYVHSILSKSRFQQPRICFCKLRSFQYELIWNRCFTFDKFYLWL